MRVLGGRWGENVRTRGADFGSGVGRRVKEAGVGSSKSGVELGSRVESLGPPGSVLVRPARLGTKHASAYANIRTCSLQLQHQLKARIFLSPAGHLVITHLCQSPSSHQHPSRRIPTLLVDLSYYSSFSPSNNPPSPPWTKRARRNRFSEAGGLSLSSPTKLCTASSRPLPIALSAKAAARPSAS